MSMSIADHLRAYSQAYPIDIFPKCDEEKLKACHMMFPNLGSSIYAESGRNFARQALEGADELDRLEAENEKLEGQRDRLVEFVRNMETEFDLGGSETEVWRDAASLVLREVGQP